MTEQNEKRVTHTNGQLTVLHSPGADAKLENVDGNANYLGFVPKGLSCISQIANTRESNYGPKAQHANTLRLAKCWNMFDEMLDFIKSIENDAEQLPKFMSKERKRIIKKEANYAK